MIYEYGRTSSSNWKPYFDVLPSSFDTLIYWSPTELEELQASAVVKKIGKKEADEMFEEKIWPIVQSQPALFGLQEDSSTKDVVVQLAHRMGSLIMAYAFDIESSEPKEADEEGYATEDEDEDLPKGMVPLADILNADANRNNVSRSLETIINGTLISIGTTILRTRRAGHEVCQADKERRGDLQRLRPSSSFRPASKIRIYHSQLYTI